MRQRGDLSMLEGLAIQAKKRLSIYKHPILTSVIAGLLSYMFMFTNKLVNPDEIECLFSKGATFISGRWGLVLLKYIFPNFSMPWIYGAITLALLTASACVIISIFRIRSKLLQCIFSASVVSFPSLTATFAYMFTASSYAIAFLCSVLAVYCFIKKGIPYKIIALVLMIFSLSIYQAYIAVTVSLFLIILIKMAAGEASSPSTILKRGVSYILFAGVALVLYYALTQLSLIVAGTSLCDYANDKISFTDGVFQRVATEYSTFFNVIFSEYFAIVDSVFSRVLHIILLITAVAGLLYTSRRLIKSPAKLLMLFGCFLLYPLAVNCIFLFVEASGVNTLVLYSYVTLYLLVIIFADDCMSEALSHLFRDVAAIVLSLIVICNIYTANIAALQMQLVYENTYAFFSVLTARIEATPGFDDNAKLCIVGNADNLIHSQNEFESGIRGITSTKYIINYSVRELFLENYIGFDMETASAEEAEAVMQSTEYTEMAEYPYDGSVRMIGDILVVNFGNIAE